MPLPDSKTSKEISCDCSGTSKEKVTQLIEQGMDTLDQISSATGACCGCGSCDITILDILAEALKKNTLTKK